MMKPFDAIAKTPVSVAMNKYLQSRLQPRIEGKTAGGDGIVDTGVAHDGWLKASIGVKDNPQDVLVSVNQRQCQVFESIDGMVQASPIFECDPQNKGNKMLVAGVPPGKVPWIYEGDSQRAFSLQYSRPCWPTETIYFVAPSASSKGLWMEIFRKLGATCPDISEQVFVTLSGPDDIGIANTVHQNLRKKMVLLGTGCGLFSLKQGNAPQRVTFKDMSGAVNVVGIHQLCNDDSNNYMLIVGPTRKVVYCKIGNNGSVSNGLTCAKLKWGKDSEPTDVCRLASGCVNGQKYIFIVTLTTMSVHTQKQSGWCLVHSAAVKQSRSGVATQSIGVVSFCASKDGKGGRFIWGDRTFWTLEPASKKATPLLDQVTFPDYYSGTTINLFAMAVFPLEQEILICFNTCGFFATTDGKRSRACKFEWVNQPKSFALLGNCLYVFSWGLVEMYDIRPGNNSTRTIVLEGVEYLGMSNNTVFASVNTKKDGTPTPQVHRLSSPVFALFSHMCCCYGVVSDPRYAFPYTYHTIL